MRNGNQNTDCNFALGRQFRKLCGDWVGTWKIGMNLQYLIGCEQMMLLITRGKLKKFSEKLFMDSNLMDMG